MNKWGLVGLPKLTITETGQARRAWKTENGREKRKLEDAMRTNKVASSKSPGKKKKAQKDLETEQDPSLKTQDVREARISWIPVIAGRLPNTLFTKAELLLQSPVRSTAHQLVAADLRAQMKEEAGYLAAFSEVVGTRSQAAQLLIDSLVGDSDVWNPEAENRGEGPSGTQYM